MLSKNPEETVVKRLEEDIRLDHRCVCVCVWGGEFRAT